MVMSDTGNVTADSGKVLDAHMHVCVSKGLSVVHCTFKDATVITRIA